IRQYDVRGERSQFHRISANAVAIACAPAIIDLRVAADRPAQLRKLLRKRRDPGQRCRIVRSQARKYANPPDALARLRTRDARPCRRAATEQRDEFAPSHELPSAKAHNLAPSVHRSEIFSVMSLPRQERPRGQVSAINLATSAA